MADSLNVYLKWLGIPIEQQPPNSYRLLGVELFEPDPDVIAHAADRQMSHIRTLAAGLYAAQAQQLLNEISAARLQLLHPQKKLAYDALLHADLIGQQGQALASVGQPASEMSSHFVDTDEDDFIPVWRHPAVLATAGICCVLVVGICTALYLKSRPQVENLVAHAGAPAQPEETTSPGETAAVPVEEASHPPVGDAASPEAEPAPVAKIDIPVVTPSPAAQPEAQAPSADVEREASEAVAKVDVPPEEQVDALAFTPANPGPPEPIDDGSPLVKPRERLPIPAAADQAQVLAEVKQIFNQEYAAARTLEQKRELARFLMQQVATVKDDPNSQYVLLSESHLLSKEGGDLTSTMRAIDQLDQYFVVAALDMKIDVMNDFARQAKNALQRQTIADLAVSLAQQAATAHQYDTAEKLATQAQSMALRLGNEKQREQARELGIDFKKRRAEWLAVQAAIETLKTSPQNQAANLVYGKYLCLDKKDWAIGLEHLAQSSDPRLVEIAQKDLVEPSDATEQIALADAWHELAASDKELAGFGLREHYWYLQALPETTGLTRTKVERRLRENTLVRFREYWLSQPGQLNLTE